MRRAIDRIYGLELFETVNYEVVREDGRTGVIVHARDRAWGPNYLRFGMALSDNFQGDDFFNLAVAYTRTELNPLGGEWRTGLAIGGQPGFFSELYQPLDPATRYFIEPRLFLTQQNLPVFDGNDQTGELRLESEGASFAVGREFGTWGELRLGLERAGGSSKLRIGDPAVPGESFDSGDLFARLSVDELDNLNFPRSGHYARLEWRHSSDALGADENFDQADVEYLGARTRGRHTIVLRARLGTTFSGTAPLQSLYRAGGFLDISGLDQNALSGQHYGLLSIGTLGRLGDIDLLPAYFGASLEVGNTWERRSEVGFDDLIAAGSVFVGLDSFLGPIYVGYGRAEGGRSSFYLFLGSPDRASRLLH
jgi:NTE family protein